MARPTHAHDLIRSRLHAQAGIGIFERPDRLLTLDSLAHSEWSPQFERFMRNRMMMGGLRYGIMARKSNKNYNYLADVERRLKLYRVTGNTEHLVDIANLCLLAFEFDKHPLKHFASADDGEHCKTH